MITDMNGVEIMEHLTNEDIDNLNYFWEEKRDIEKWYAWKTKRPLIEREFPELIKVWTEYKVAIKLMHLILQDAYIVDRDEDEDEGSYKNRYKNM